MVKKGEDRRPTTQYCHSKKIDTITQRRLTWTNIAKAVKGELPGQQRKKRPRRRGTRGKGRKINYS